MFTASSGLFAYPMPEDHEVKIFVGEEPAHFEIPVSQASIIDLDVVDAHGDEYSGPLEMTFVEGKPGMTGETGDVLVGFNGFNFQRPPYQICVGHGGTYLIGPAWPAWDPKVHKNIGEILQVGAQQTVHPRIVIQ